MGRILYEITRKPGGGWEVAKPLHLLIEAFREERLELLAAGAPVVLEASRHVVLHFVPHTSLLGDIAIDLRQFTQDAPEELQPLGSSGYRHRFNCDGYLTFTPTSDGKASGYLQLFRNGIVETTDTDCFFERGDVAYLASRSFEDDLIAAVSRCLTLAERLGMAGPYEAAVTIIGAGDVLMAVNPDLGWRHHGHPVGRDRLLVPAVRLEPSADPALALRPAFDVVWQATGWAGSRNYDAEGKRTP
jgi:hypothetical protein